MSIFTQYPEGLYRRLRQEPGAAWPAFSRETASLTASMAQLAYETIDPGKVGRILESWGWALQGIHAGSIGGILPLTSARGFIARRAGVNILAFSGTDSLKLSDWVLDLSLRRSADGIHRGFETGVEAVWPAISALTAAGGKILVTGHSLGGALAVVAAHRLTRMGGEVAGVYTFGMPRAGDEGFARTYRAAEGLGERTYRFVHGADIVPQVPPAWAPFAFRHVGRPLSCGMGRQFDLAAPGPDEPEVAPPGRAGLKDLSANLTRRRDPRAPELPDFPGHAMAVPVIGKLPPAIRDHLMDRYLLALGVL